MPKFSVFRPLARRMKQNLFVNLHVLCTVADAEKKGTVARLACYINCAVYHRRGNLKASIRAGKKSHTIVLDK